MEQVAVNLGFSLLRDNRDRRTGIARHKPAITELVSNLFNVERLYRILSGVAHSDYVTLSRISFVAVESDVGEGTVKQRAIRHELQNQRLVSVAAAYVKAAWRQ